MKRTTFPTALFAFVLAIGLTPAGQAHDRQEDHGARLAKHMEHAAERLKLSDAQKQQLRPLVEEHVAKAKAIRDKYPPESSPEQKQQMHHEMRAVREDYDGKVQAVLTEEQRQEWEKMRAERRDRMREHKREHKDPAAT
jgi:Spy/CpxP family protein refolding chaperone